MSAFPETRGWRPTADVADATLMRSRMEVRAPHVAPAPQPEPVVSPFAVPTLPWVAGIELGGKHLTPREIELLALIRDGTTNKQAAFVMGCSEQTVKNHMSSILAKLRVPDRTAAVLAAIRGGSIVIGEGASTPPIAEASLAAAEDRLRRIIDVVSRALAEIAAIRTGLDVPQEQPAIPRRSTGICSVAGCSDVVAAYRGNGRPPLKCERHVRRAVAA